VSTTTSKTAGVSQRHRRACTRPTRCDCPWSFIVELPPGIDGKRRQITKGGYSGVRAAKAARDAVIADHRDGHLDTDRKITVDAYLRRWLDAKMAVGAIRPATIRSYRDHLDRFIGPNIGHLRLVDLTPADLDRMYRSITKAHPNLSASSITRVHATLRSAFRHAVKRGEVKHDVTAHVVLPKTSRPKVRTWQAAQFAAFIGSPDVQAHPLAPLFHLGALAGLRRGELVALRWQDVDLDAAVLTVRQQATQVGHDVVIGKPKTASGEDRTVDLDRGTVAVLRTRKRQQAAHRLAFGPAWADTDGRVFTREDGRSWHPESVTKTFTRLSRKVTVEGKPLPLVRLHDLRHLQASLMLAAGVPMAVVSKRLGHSSVVITSDTYSHLLDGVGAAAAEAAAALIPSTTAANS
jgi:integrase